MAQRYDAIFVEVRAKLGREIILSKTHINYLVELGVDVDAKNSRITGSWQSVCKAREFLVRHYPSNGGRWGVNGGSKWGHKNTKNLKNEEFVESRMVDADVYSLVAMGEEYKAMLRQFKVIVKEEQLDGDYDIINVTFSEKNKNNMMDFVSYFQSIYERRMRFVDRATIDLSTNQLQDLWESEINKAVKATKKDFPNVIIRVSEKFERISIAAPHGRSVVDAKAKLAAILLKTNKKLDADSIFYNERFRNKYNGFVVSVGTGNIAEQRTDAIVNAANDQLQYGGGVTGAIYDAGGYSFGDECKKMMKARKDRPLTPGEVVSTKACGKLKCKRVLHMLGPMWYGITDHIYEENASLLLQGLENVLKVCEEHKLASVSLPPVSTGIYGGPLDVFLDKFCEAVLKYQVKTGGHPTVKMIRLVALDNYTVDDMRKYFASFTASKVAVGSVASIQGHKVVKEEPRSMASKSAHDVVSNVQHSGTSIPKHGVVLEEQAGMASLKPSGVASSEKYSVVSEEPHGMATKEHRHIKPHGVASNTVNGVASNPRRDVADGATTTRKGD
uniref:uncharacterized protein LOC100176257 n=1 Tax=Ciona intestinalis TaxID=7719 RepID=UPI0002B8DF46|nr:uncharacterized protein LOC100176257 [Ciona intestinalis]|eukprot:XP_002121791.2 uncharacterized protein LOC100176257 [Ciona intestinalis]